MPGNALVCCPQVHRSIQQQLSLFRELTGHQYIQVDGHQHVHLIPMVLDDLLDQADEQGINWIRTTREAIPSGLRVSDWARACRNGGWVKWFILQLLSKQAKRRLKEQGISTNQSFAGVLFTGQMVGMPLQLAWEQLHSQGTRPRTESPLILIHPAKYPIEENEMQDKGFGESQQFFSSIMRQKELQAAKSLKRARTSEP